MKIKPLVIENFKSIERIELIEPNPFTVFVGPNGSGKSNIFEALEFVNLGQERVRWHYQQSFWWPRKLSKKAKSSRPIFSLSYESN